MNNCKYCKADCALRGEENLKECNGHIPMTNADRIRSMTEEELAELIVKHYPMHACNKQVREIYFSFDDHRKDNPQRAWLEWLRQPAEGDGRAQ